MTAAYTNTKQITLSASQHALLDSGTSLTYIPTAEYNQVITLVTAGKQCNTTQGILYCRCSGTSDSSFPTFYMTFTNVDGGKQ
jgi:hypothetical protein